MPILFHQNMRHFGGGAGPVATLRRNAYNQTLVNGGAFANIANGLGVGVGPVAVAGFTEITNNGVSQGTLVNSCTRLGIVAVGNVACGITALAHGSEFIFIGRSAGYGLLTVGRILFGAGHGGVVLFHQRAATAAALNGLGYPMGMSADYRGLVYVVVTVPGGIGNIAVGFLHNLYNFIAQRITVAAQLGNMMNMMGQPASGLAGVGGIVARYIGGDFNVAPISPRGGFTGYLAGPPGYPPGAAGVGTTYSGSMYDYWYSSVNAGAVPAGGYIVPLPTASSLTLDSGPGAVAAGNAGLMSDHAATMLQII
ncbi:hypothetical protein NIES4101_25990 (plasmid) [Calothrix sp. NIES-4101]|nr:hypothetical protein NIES4101_25990 [Calothrix sp. NIES-4101]